MVNISSITTLTLKNMARRKENGTYRGLVGNIILYERNGEQQMRTKSPVRKDKSRLVINSQDDFRVILKLVLNFKPLIDIGFKDHKVNRSAYHSALSVNRLNYNYAKTVARIDNLGWFQFSEGNLSGAAEVSAIKNDNGMIEIKWQGTEKELTAHDDDRVIACIRFCESGIIILGPDNVKRETGYLIIDPGRSIVTKKIEVFISFTVNMKNYNPGSDRNVSKSRWIGLI